MGAYTPKSRYAGLLPVDRAEVLRIQLLLVQTEVQGHQAMCAQLRRVRAQAYLTVHQRQALDDELTWRRKALKTLDGKVFSLNRGLQLWQAKTSERRASRVAA